MRAQCAVSQFNGCSRKVNSLKVHSRFVSWFYFGKSHRSPSSFGKDGDNDVKKATENMIDQHEPRESLKRMLMMIILANACKGIFMIITWTNVDKKTALKRRQKLVRQSEHEHTANNAKCVKVERKRAEQCCVE